MRGKAWPYYIYILTVVLAVGLGGLLAGIDPLTAQDQAQSRLSQAAPVPHGDTVVGQTFVAGHNGLSAVEVLAVVYPNTSLSLHMQLIDAQGRPLDGRPAPRLNLRYPQAEARYLLPALPFIFMLMAVAACVVVGAVMLAAIMAVRYGNEHARQVQTAKYGEATQVGDVTVTALSITVLPSGH